MKKVIYYVIIFVFICFILPVICTKTKEVIGEELILNNEVVDEKDESTIRLLHKETGEIETIKIKDYLYGVLSAEMPVEFELEALKAQAITSRTYLIYQIKNNVNKHEGADICDSYECCQAWMTKEKRLEKWNENNRETYWNKIVQAVDETNGKIIQYNGEPIKAFFHANSGGITECSINIWGRIDYPYLKSVQTEGEENYSQYSSTVSFSYEEFLSKLKEKYENVEINFDDENSIKILEYNSSWRVNLFLCGNIELTGTETRAIFGLKSTNFSVKKEDGKITFEVVGSGHGIGLSQTGADALAKTGCSYDEIIKHFYLGVEIGEIN